MGKKLKAVITTWHTPHQYDLVTALKEYVEFDIIVNTNKSWLGRPVPVPEQTNFVASYDKSKKYDFAILNLDQQCMNQKIYKSQIFPQMKEAIADDVPIIVLQHG